MPEKPEVKKWWQEDWTQEIGLIVIGAVIGLCIFKIPEGQQIGTIVGTGIGAVGGYLTGKKISGNGGAP